MNQIRFTLMCLVGLSMLLVGGAAGCDSALDDSARALNTTAVVVQTPVKSMTAVDRMLKGATVAAVRGSTMTIAAARQDLACRAERATVLKMTDQTRTALDSFGATLSELPPSVAADDAAVDAELASLQQ